MMLSDLVTKARCSCCKVVEAGIAMRGKVFRRGVACARSPL